MRDAGTALLTVGCQSTRHMTNSSHPPSTGITKYCTGPQRIHNGPQRSCIRLQRTCFGHGCPFWDVLRHMWARRL